MGCALHPSLWNGKRVGPCDLVALLLFVIIVGMFISSLYLGLMEPNLASFLAR